MEINDFVNKFAEQFEEAPKEAFSPDVKFRDFDEWDSLKALSIIAMVDEEYDKQIGGADIRSVNTIRELFEIVKTK